jgi:NAD(P)-dependent dehydrogenase (short-subunit alcohol dehydrogenase family)
VGIESVAVLGAGTMGAGIAGCLARAGLRVALADASPELAEQAQARLLERTRGHVAGALLAAGATEATASVAVARDIDAAVGDVDLVVEAVPEDQGLKEEVLGRCSAAAPTTAIIGSNTSSLPIEGLDKWHIVHVRHRRRHGPMTGAWPARGSPTAWASIALRGRPRVADGVRSPLRLAPPGLASRATDAPVVGGPSGLPAARVGKGLGDGA